MTALKSFIERRVARKTAEEMALLVSPLKLNEE
jgi:transposase-like protein